MEFLQEKNTLTNRAQEVLVLGIFQDEKIDDILKAHDSEFPADLLTSMAEISQMEGFTGKTGQVVSLPTYGRLPTSKLILRGLGKFTEYDTSAVRKAAASTARRLSAHGIFKSICLDLRIDGQKTQIQGAVEGWLLGTYKFGKYKTQKDQEKKGKPAETVAIAAANVEDQDFAQALHVGKVLGDATNFARDLIAEPAQFMTPTRLAETASSLAGGSISCQILDEAAANKLGMGAFLGVARGAKEPAKFIVLKYTNPAARRTIAIVGKGITFDSGGLSLKTAQGMEHMKYDMSGAAAVIGTISAMADLQPAINVWGVVAATENMPGDNALHPGDVLVAMNGKTIEVNNTDAEGRLVLADALSYIDKQKPDQIIDLATLTGAVVTALGRAAAGIMGNDEKLIQRLIEAGALAGEKYWQLPLFDDYKESLKSDIADLKNAGARGEAPSSCAAMFLKEFVNGRPWAHLDIAGPAWAEKEKDELNKGGTAFGLRTLCYYLLSQQDS